MAGSERQRETVREDVRLRGVDATGVVIGEAVRDLGLEPSRVLAVIPAECARGGRISRNGTLYLPEELREAHLALCEAAKTQFVEGQIDPETGRHPDEATWNIPVRLFDGDVVSEADGSNLTRGRFAILNTTTGRDLFVCWQEGLDIGVSLFGGAFVESRVLTQESRFAAMNPGRVGATYREMSGFQLDRYDIVRTASFGTNFRPASEQAREAFARVSEAFRGAGEAAAADSSQAPGEGAQTTQETLMDIKTLDELRAKYPDLVRQAEAAAKAADPMAALSADQRKLLERMVEAVGDDKDPDVKATLRAVQENAGADRERLATLEATVRTQAQETAQLKQQAEAERAERQKLQTRLAVIESLDGLKKGHGPLGELVATYVREELEGGRIASVDAAKQVFERQVKLAENAQKLAQVGGEGTGAGSGGTQQVGEGAGAGAGQTQRAAGESPDSSPQPARESVSPLLSVVRSAAV